jgi:putative transposase
LKETKTISQLAAEQGVHPNVLREWRTTALQGLPSLFAKGDSLQAIPTAYEQQIEVLYAQR